MDKEKLKIGEAAHFLGVTVQTLRNWGKSGKLLPDYSSGGHRYYSRQILQNFILDLPHLGWTWASGEKLLELQPEHYCEQQSRFTSRLEKMGELLVQAGGSSKEKASLLVAVAGEIGDNSFMHNIGNWPDTLGIFFAYDIGKRIIVLADRGQGVRKTLLRVCPNIKTDVDALRIAFTEVVSGRHPEKRGNGLKVVKEIVESHPIGLVFHSGNALVKSPKKPWPIKIKKTSKNISGVYSIITF
jgi:DNA-binding transcriptional MerR regulator